MNLRRTMMLSSNLQILLNRLRLITKLRVMSITRVKMRSAMKRRTNKIFSMQTSPLRETSGPADFQGCWRISTRSLRTLRIKYISDDSLLYTYKFFIHHLLFLKSRQGRRLAGLTLSNCLNYSLNLSTASLALLALLTLSSHTFLLTSLSILL